MARNKNVSNTDEAVAVAEGAHTAVSANPDLLSLSTTRKSNGRERVMKKSVNTSTRWSFNRTAAEILTPANQLTLSIQPSSAATYSVISSGHARTIVGSIFSFEDVDNHIPAQYFGYLESLMSSLRGEGWSVAYSAEAKTIVITVPGDQTCA